MDIIIKGVNFDLTPANKEYVHTKMDGLTKYGTIDRLDVELELTSRHHHKDDGLWSATANVHVFGKSIRAEAQASDLHIAIDKVKDEMKRELLKAKEKRMQAKQSGARERKYGGE